MSTVKIKTEPTAAAAAAKVDVKVKLEPSLSTADIKLEQHTSDIDTKVESESEYDSEESEEDIKSESDNGNGNEDSDGKTDLHQRKVICDYPGCGRSFKSAGNLRMHQHDHELQTKINIIGKTYTLARQSLNDRWSCPTQSCEIMLRTVGALRSHIRKFHGDNMGQQQQPPAKKTRNKLYFHGVDNFYVNGVRCGYHNTVGVFICYECRLVPECLLTHLQNKHGFDEKSIDSSVLPERAVNASADPNTDQHTSNPLLAATINQPYLQHHPDIVQGWLCVTSDCGYCGDTVYNKTRHKGKVHQGEQLTTVPALVLRLVYAKTQNSCYLITRIDQANGAVTTRNSRVSRHNLDYNHNVLNVRDENEDDISQNETTDASNRKRQYICDYDNCRLYFNSSAHLSMHRREHKREVVINVHGSTFALSRQSSDDRWPCPIPGCDSTCKTICSIREHILKAHSTSAKHKHGIIEDDNNQQQQKQIIKKRQLAIRYFYVDDFYVNGTRCGYHTTTGLFICHECRLVPECLLTHLQQKHGYDDKSIDNAFIPDSARTSGSNSNGNQHTSNPHLASTISQPYQQQHQDIVQGWLCVTSNCGFCCSTQISKYNHQQREHRGEQQLTAPALVLRLIYSKTQTSWFLITRLDTITNNNVKSSNPTSQYNSECDYEEDDGDELVLSDMGDDSDIN